MTAVVRGAAIRWVVIPGGAFSMGSDDFYPAEAPRHRRHVAPFELAATPVTNAQFAAFVEDTGYVTCAERPLPEQDFPHLPAADRAPGSLVFTPTDGPVDLSDWQQWWQWRPGAHWRQPQGTGPLPLEWARHPVVHIAYADAQAFAEWAGGRLPTEAELEYASAAGADGTPYAWGEERDVNSVLMANTWRGQFPYRNDGASGWRGTSPVGTFPVNAFGLYDCIGNVWEWTSDVYTPSHHSVAGSLTMAIPESAGCGCGCGPTASGEGAQRVLKGGSHLCAPEYCLRYRPAARSPQAEDSSTSHIGFRVARDVSG